MKLSCLLASRIPENIAPSAGVLDELRKNLEEIASLGDADAGREDDKKMGSSGFANYKKTILNAKG